MYEIGQNIPVTLLTGEAVVGVVEGRNWCFDDLVSYTVRVRGYRHNVNANSLQAGHSF